MNPADIGDPGTTKTPIWWIGGKHHSAKWIIEHFPEHRCYVEPFGGGASVLLQKKPSKVEIYNDIDGRVCEFFEVLRDRPWELVAVVTFFPYSRRLFDEWKKLAKADLWPEDKVKRVAMWFYLQRSSFSGKFVSGWSHGKTRNTAATWSNVTALLIDVANRLKKVQIESRDFREVIPNYDSEETFYYCDPPYFQAKPDYYSHGFSMKDHEDLARMLHKIEGKVCLSYYPHPKVDELYPDWKRAKKGFPCWSVRTKGKKKPMRSELLLMNYDVRRRRVSS